VLTNHLKAKSELSQWGAESYDLEDQQQKIQIYLLYRQSGNEMYALQKIKDLNNIHPCFLTCDDCKLCFHHYSCSCDDYVVNHNMCKHIHLLRMHLVEQMQAVYRPSTPRDAIVQFPEDNAIEIDTPEDLNDADTDEASECPERTNDSFDFQVYKSTLQCDSQIETKKSLWTKAEQLNLELQGQLTILKHEDLSIDALKLVVKQLSRLTLHLKNLPNESDKNVQFTPKKSSKRHRDLQIRFSPKKRARSSKQKRKLF